MTLPAAVLKQAADRLAADPTIEGLQNLVRDILGERQAELVWYLYGQLTADEARRGEVQAALLAGLIDDPPLTMPADMDARIRQRLFGPMTAPAQPARPIAGWDMPDMSTGQINTPWEAHIAGRLIAYRQVWEKAPRRLDRATARRNMIVWRAVERVMHLDFTALEELQAEHQQQPLDAEVIEQLHVCRAELLRMAAEIERLTSRQQVGPSRD